MSKIELRDKKELLNTTVKNKKSLKDRLVILKFWFLSRSLFVKILILLFVAGGVFFAYKRIAAGRSQQVQYQTSTTEKSTLIVSVSASGSVMSSNKMPITTSATGIISKVYVKDGDKVTKGQKIADIELDSDGAQRNASAYSSYQSALNSARSAESSLRSAQASLDVVYDEVKGHDTDETLTMKETRTKAEVAKDNAYFNLQLTKNQVNSSHLSYLESSPSVVANSSGTIGNITIVPGMDISTTVSSSGNVSTTRVAIIETQGLPIATFNLSEIDVSKVQQDQKATVTFDSIADKTFTGKVVSVDRIGIVSSGVTSYPIIIQFDNQISQLLPNMSAQANIIIDTVTDTLLVPSSAVQTTNGQSGVRVLKNGNISNVVVEIGKSSDSQIQILSGLSEGDVVVTGVIQQTTQSTSQTQSPFSAFGGTRGGTSTRGGGNAVFLRN